MLLQLLAMIRTDESLGELIRLLNEDRPRDWTESAQILSPLMQHNDWPVEAFFPACARLLAVRHACIATPGSVELSGTDRPSRDASGG